MYTNFTYFRTKFDFSVRPKFRIIFDFSLKTDFRIIFDIVSNLILESDLISVSNLF